MITEANTMVLCPSRYSGVPKGGQSPRRQRRSRRAERTVEVLIAAVKPKVVDRHLWDSCLDSWAGTGLIGLSPRESGARRRQMGPLPTLSVQAAHRRHRTGERVRCVRMRSGLLAEQDTRSSEYRRRLRPDQAMSTTP